MSRTGAARTADRLRALGVDPYREIEGGWLVDTGLRHADGEVVGVYVTGNAGGWRLSDNADTLFGLRTRGLPLARCVDALRGVAAARGVVLHQSGELTAGGADLAGLVSAMRDALAAVLVVTAAALGEA